MAPCNAPYIISKPNNIFELSPGRLCPKIIPQKDVATASRCPQCLSQGKTTYACPRSVDLIQKALKQKYPFPNSFVPICFACLPKLRAMPSSKLLALQKIISEDGNRTTLMYEHCECINQGVDMTLRSGNCYHCAEGSLRARKELVEGRLNDHPVWTRTRKNEGGPGTWTCLCSEIQKRAEGPAAMICLGCANWQDFEAQGELKLTIPSKG